MEFRPSRRGRAGLDFTPLRAVSMSITPLVDTMLTLLIFVLLLGAFAIQPAIRVRLPEAVSKEDTSSRSSYSSSPAIIISTSTIDGGRDEFGARLQERLRDRADAVVIIKADKEVFHGRVVEVMDIAKAAGAMRIAIATEPKLPEAGVRSP